MRCQEERWMVRNGNQEEPECNVMNERWVAKQMESRRKWNACSCSPLITFHSISSSTRLQGQVLSEELQENSEMNGWFLLLLFNYNGKERTESPHSVTHSIPSFTRFINYNTTKIWDFTTKFFHHSSYSSCRVYLCLWDLYGYLLVYNWRTMSEKNKG